MVLLSHRSLLCCGPNAKRILCANMGNLDHHCSVNLLKKLKMSEQFSWAHLIT